MTEQEKIEKAAEKHALEYIDQGDSVMEAADYDFKAGIAWARANPPQEHIKTEGEKKGDDYYKSTDRGVEEAAGKHIRHEHSISLTSECPICTGIYGKSAGHARGVEEGKAQMLHALFEMLNSLEYKKKARKK